MFDLRPVLFYTGIALSVLAMAMAFPAAVDIVHGNADWRIFAASASVTLFLGLILMAGNKNHRIDDLSVRQVFLLTVSCWLAAALAASLPFAFSGLKMSSTDAVFEAVSGITATGSTVLRGLDVKPPGILLWRSLLQWLGGAGFLVTSVVLLPALNIGGMQMFQLGTLGERALPRAAKVAAALLAIYFGLTVVLTLLLWAAGMSRFPALLHAMSTISCGGFSTADASVGQWRSPNIDWVILFGMLAGGAPFILYLHIAQRRWRMALRNTQLRWYLAIFAAAAIGIGSWLLLTQGVKPLPAIRHGAFTAASMMTGTGYATLDWGRWQGLPLVIMFFLSFIGGCAGSTAGGIKIFRFQVLLENARVQMVRMLRPNTILAARYERAPIPDVVAVSVLGFLFVYTLSFAVLAMALGLLGLDFMSAISASASALANLGPGLTEAVGPTVGYAGLPDTAKWLLSAAMLFGRVEMFAVLVLFTNNFWRP